MNEPKAITRREYLMTEILRRGYPWIVAREAISSTAIEHPDWDMDERRTYIDWLKVKH